MRPEIARLVFPVLTTGLLRKQELIGGVALELAEVQKELAGLLQATSQTEAWVHPGRFGKDFLGIQYALACWLDFLLRLRILIPMLIFRSPMKKE